MLDITINNPSIWEERRRSVVGRDASALHKYSRGHVLIFAGGISTSGATLLAARAAQRAGAGAVTIASPSSAMMLYAAASFSTLLRRCDDLQQVEQALSTRPVSAALIGSGFGASKARGAFAREIIRMLGRRKTPILLDADIFTHYAARAGELREDIGGARCIITPHEAEFRRMFGGDTPRDTVQKAEMTIRASDDIGAVVVYKGSDTMISDGRTCVHNKNAPVSLATAGSGDVLAGVAASFMSQGIAPLQAACAAVHHHTEAAACLPENFIAEELANSITPL